MRSRFLVVILICTASAAAADYPGREWAPHSLVGWSEPLLKAAREYLAAQKTQSVMIVQSGQVVYQWGDVTRKIEVRSGSCSCGVSDRTT